jgi:hypothetical protein
MRLDRWVGRRGEAGIAVALAALGSLAAGSAHAQEFLSPARLQIELGGQTIKGYYVDTTIRFVEVYQPDGRITYKDDLKADAGNWSVRGMAFCTFYDKIGGGCWYVVKRSGNCFEFYSAPDTGNPITRDDLAQMRPRALAARDSDNVTCELWQGA